MSAIESARPEVPTVIYDGECRGCGLFARLLAKADLRQDLSILPFQSSSARALLGDWTQEEIGGSVHLVTPDGQVLSAGAAVQQTLSLLPFIGPVHQHYSTSTRVTRLVGAVYTLGVVIRGAIQCGMSRKTPETSRTP